MRAETLVIEAVKAGDVEQYSWLVNENSAKVFALAKSLLGTKEDAEEVTQDVFLKAYNSLDQFRGDSKFSTYLYTICYNLSLNVLRKRKPEVDVDDAVLPDTEINDGFYNLKAEEQKYFLNLTLEKLNSEFRMMINFFYLQELSYNEIVETTGMTLANVKVKLHRAKNALADELNKTLKGEVRNLI